MFFQGYFEEDTCAVVNCPKDKRQQKVFFEENLEISVIENRSLGFHLMRAAWSDSGAYSFAYEDGKLEEVFL